MTIKKELITSYSPKQKNKTSSYSKWFLYGASGIGIFLAVNLAKSVLPLLGIGLLIAFVWSQATKPS